jgi:hypothetical protein
MAGELWGLWLFDLVRDTDQEPPDWVPSGLRKMLMAPDRP